MKYYYRSISVPISNNFKTDQLDLFDETLIGTTTPGHREPGSNALIWFQVFLCNTNNSIG